MKEHAKHTEDREKQHFIYQKAIKNGDISKKLVTLALSFIKQLLNGGPDKLTLLVGCGPQALIW